MDGGNSKQISDVYNEGNIEITTTQAHSSIGHIGGICGGSSNNKISNAINLGITNTHLSVTGTIAGVASPNEDDYNKYTNCYYAYETGYNILQGEKVSIQETRSKDFFNKINSNDAWERELGKTPNLKGADKTFIRKQTNLTIRNTKEKYNVTVNILNKGGNIAGYTSKTIVETINKGEDSTKEIKITPDDSYQIGYILLNGEQYAFTANEDKTFTMPQFTNMQENKLIEVSFVKNPVTITKQDSTTGAGLKGAKFKIEEQNTNTDISNTIGKLTDGNSVGYSIDKEDTDGLENALGEMTNTLSYGFVKQSDGSYIPQNGLAYQKSIGKSKNLEATAESYMKIDLSSFPTTEKYKINLRASHTYDTSYTRDSLCAKITQSASSISSSLSDGCFIKTSAKFENKKYSSEELQGGKIYYLHIYFKAEYSYYGEDACIKDIEIVHLTKNTGTKYYNFEEKDGKYVSTNGGAADTDCESYIPIDLSNNTGSYILYTSSLTTGSREYSTGSKASIYLTDTTDENAEALRNFSTSGIDAYILSGKQKYYLYFKYHEGKDSSYDVIQDTDNLTVSIQLEVKQAGYSAEVQTDAGGKVKFDLPYYGDFKITETEAPEGYSIAEPVMYSYTADSSTDVVIKDEKIGKLNVHHYMKKADGTYTTTKLAEDESRQGDDKEKYTTSPKINIKKYTLEKDSSGNYVIPQNASGTYEGGKTIDVTYYYEPLKATSVKVKYLDKETNEPLHEEKTLTGYVGDYYLEKPISISGYVLELLPENREGKMTEDPIEVIFYYSKNTNIVVKYVDKYTNEEIADEEIIKGIAGKEYSAEDKKKEIDGYIYTENSGNLKGIFQNAPVEIIYYYVKKSKITVKIIDEDTLKEIDKRTIIDGFEGKDYAVTPPDEENYTYTGADGELKGKMTREDFEITLKYKRKKDDTLAPKPIPKTGEKFITISIIIAVGVLLTIEGVAIIKYNKLNK